LIFLTADSPTTIYLQIIDHQIETYNKMHIELQAIMRTGTRIQKYDDKNRYFKFFFPTISKLLGTTCCIQHRGIWKRCLIEKLSRDQAFFFL
jgi:hypothetical protein